MTVAHTIAAPAAGFSIVVPEKQKSGSTTDIALADSTTLAQIHAAAELDQQANPQKYPTATDPYWERFHRAFSSAKTLVSFSPVGYESNYTRALVYVTFGCGGLCGGSHTVLLQRTGTAWRMLRVRDKFVV